MEADEGGQGRGSGHPPPAATNAGPGEQQGKEEQEETARRESEELNPMSLADLFARDPECAAKNKEQPQPSRSLLFAGSQLDHELELKKLQVFVRIRPSVTAGAPHPKSSAGHPGWELENCVHATSKFSIAIAPPEGSQAYRSGDRGQTYSFSRVFDSNTSQHDYYEQTAAPLVRDLLRNKQHNSVMMAYGITAAGKTYTIEGTRDEPGVMPRAMLELFEGLSSHVEPVAARASYYEVYNEQIYDLLDEQGVGPLGQRGVLRLKEDTLGRVFVAGLLEVEVSSPKDALALLRRGSKQRQRAETGLNYSSSRSHSIFTVTLYQQGLEGQPSGGAVSNVSNEEEEACCSEEKLGHISFVDLAGSERAQRTGNVGVRLKESVAINSSLMTLGRCLEALRWNQQHKGGSNLRVVPYRESKVTHLFRDALHGWGQVVLSVNVSPVSKDYDETAHVLKYAALATQIGTIQQAEAPRRTIKAVSPAIKKVKRKAALPPEARRQGGNKAKKAKKAAKGAPAVARPTQQTDLAAIPETTELAAEASGEVESFEPAPAAPAPVAEDSDAGQGAELRGVLVEDPGMCCGGAAESDVEEEAEDAELVEGEFGTPSTPADDDEAVAALQVQVQRLIAELQQAEERCVLLEAEVREEVADEMAQLLRDMEESYRQRLEAEVEALERKVPAGCGGAAVAEGGRRGRARGNKQTVAAPSPDASAQKVAAAREEAAKATAEAEQLRQHAASSAADLKQARQQLAALQEQVEQQEERARQQQAQAAERVAGLETEVAAARHAAAQERELVGAHQTRAAELEAELDAARQQAGEVQACVIAEQQRGAALEADLAATRQQLQRLQSQLETMQQRAAELEGEVVALREAAQRSHEQASRQYDEQLREAVTQLEANRGMELEMAEEQAERLRKENLALQRRLQATLAALAACGSPLVGPGGLAARMAQAAPEGGGRGAGGTPHDVALARARQAAAADDRAAAAAAAGGSTLARTRSRFAGQTETGGSCGVGEGNAGPTVPAEEKPATKEQPQDKGHEEARPAPRLHSRPKKTVAFASPPQFHGELEAAAGQQPLQQAPPAAAAMESRRSRRMTRAAAAASVVGDGPVDAAPAAVELEGDSQQMAVEVGKTRRGRRRTQAPPAAAVRADAVQPDTDPEPPARQAVQAQPQLDPGTAGGRGCGMALGVYRVEEEDTPLMASVNLEQQPSHTEPEAAEAAAAKPAAQQRRRGRLPSNKENSSNQAKLPPADSKPSVAPEEQSTGGRRRKRLLPGPPMSTEMRAALGEPEDSLSLRQHVAKKQAAAAAAAGAGPAPEPAGKRSRRQTQFYRL